MDNKALDLLEIRDQIDGIDKEIVELFEKRMQLSAEVAEYKISTGKKILKPILKEIWMHIQRSEMYQRVK